MNWLIDVGCDVDDAQPSLHCGDYGGGQATPLVFAQTSEAVRLLCARGADADVWWTPANYNSNLDARPVIATCVDPLALARHGANINAVAYSEFAGGQCSGTQLKFDTAPVSFWPSVVASGNVALAKELVERYNANIHWPHNVHGLSSSRHRSGFKNTLCGEDQYFGLGATVLQIAVMNQNVEMVQMLLYKNISTLCDGLKLQFAEKNWSKETRLGVLNNALKMASTGIISNEPEDVSISADAISYNEAESFDNNAFMSNAQRKHYWEEKTSWDSFGVTTPGTGILGRHIPERKKLATALSIACSTGNREIIQLLKDAGAVSHPENATTPVTIGWAMQSAWTTEMGMGMEKKNN